MTKFVIKKTMAAVDMFERDDYSERVHGEYSNRRHADQVLAALKAETHKGRPRFKSVRLEEVK